jgi:hypothetical protein
MAYEHTLVAVSKSQESIRRLILDNGGSGIAFISQPPMEGFEAVVRIDNASYRIRISAEVKVVEKRRRRRYGIYKPQSQIQDDAARRVWRVLFFYLKNVYEASNSGVMDFRQLVMPYVVTRDNKTISEHILPKLESAIQGNPERMLPAPKDHA